MKKLVVIVIACALLGSIVVKGGESIEYFVPNDVSYRNGVRDPHVTQTSRLDYENKKSLSEEVLDLSLKFGLIDNPEQAKNRDREDVRRLAEVWSARYMQSRYSSFPRTSPGAYLTEEQRQAMVDFAPERDKYYWLIMESYGYPNQSRNNAPSITRQERERFLRFIQDDFQRLQSDLSQAHERLRQAYCSTGIDSSATVRVTPAVQDGVEGINCQISCIDDFLIKEDVLGRINELKNLNSSTNLSGEWIRARYTPFSAPLCSPNPLKKDCETMTISIDNNLLYSFSSASYNASRKLLNDDFHVNESIVGQITPITQNISDNRGPDQELSIGEKLSEINQNLDLDQLNRDGRLDGLREQLTNHMKDILKEGFSKTPPDTLFVRGMLLAILKSGRRSNERGFLKSILRNAWSEVKEGLPRSTESRFKDAMDELIRGQESRTDGIAPDQDLIRRIRELKESLDRPF